MRREVSDIALTSSHHREIDVTFQYLPIWEFVRLSG